MNQSRMPIGGQRFNAQRSGGVVDQLLPPSLCVDVLEGGRLWGEKTEDRDIAQGLA
jgi:hypothetical protein